MLTSAGIGSGLDINQLVSDLVAAESAPKIALLDKKEAVITAKISAYGLLKSALSEFKASLTALANTDTYNTRSASSSDRSKFTVTADATAVTGNYSLEISQLAEAHKLSSTGFTDSSTVVGTGDLTLAVGTNAFTVTIDDSNSSLAGIRDAINNATDNTGITATIVNVDDGLGGTESRLVLTSNTTGTSNEITVTAVNGASGDLQQLVYDPAGSGVTNLVERNAAQDAIVLVDNQTVTSSSNNLSGVIDGLSINLLDADPGVTHSINISLNSANITSAVGNLVDNYNSFVETLVSVTAYSENGSGALIGDALARSAANQIRQQLTGQVNSISSAYNSLAALGITTDRNGYMSIDNSKLDAAIANDSDAVRELFSGTNGIATRLENTLNEYVKANGIVDSKTSSLNESIDDITDQREQLNRYLESFQARLLDQFIAMDTLVQQLNDTSNYLTNALANLPKPASIKSSK